MSTRMEMTFNSNFIWIQKSKDKKKEREMFERNKENSNVLLVLTARSTYIK